jgi:hypothetical protein
MHYLPLTEALVNVEATFRRLVERGLLDGAIGEELLGVARGLFFKDLTFEAVLARCALSRSAAAEAAELIEQYRADLKRADAHALVARMRDLPARRNVERPSWEMSEPSSWRRQIARLTSARRKHPYLE